MSLPPDPTFVMFLPIANKIIREGEINTADLQGTDYAEFLEQEVESLAYLLAATTVARLIELR